jgi:hypothetical protein
VALPDPSPLLFPVVLQGRTSIGPTGIPAPSSCGQRIRLAVMSRPARDRARVRLGPAKAVTASASGPSQAHSYEHVRHLDWKAAGFDELFARDQNKTGT